MYITLSHFELAQMTTSEYAQRRIRRPLLVPKAESPQDDSPSDMPTHEIWAFHVVRKSDNTFTITWCWPGKQQAGQRALQATSATSCVSVCFIQLMRLVSNSQTFMHSKSALLCGNPRAYGVIPAHPGRSLWRANCREEGLSLFHICILISTL